MPTSPSPSPRGPSEAGQIGAAAAAPRAQAACCPPARPPARRAHCHIPAAAPGRRRARSTHWKQTVFYLKDTLIVHQGDVISGGVRGRARQGARAGGEVAVQPPRAARRPSSHWTAELLPRTCLTRTPQVSLAAHQMPRTLGTWTLCCSTSEGRGGALALQRAGAGRRGCERRAGGSGGHRSFCVQNA